MTGKPLSADSSDHRLSRHACGFLEVVDKPDDAALQSYYADSYYQHQSGNYRSSYGDVELACIRQRIEHRYRLTGQLAPLTDESLSMLDVGCGEGFAMAYFEQQGFDVLGLDFSDHGVMCMNPSLQPHIRTGDVFTLLQTQINSGAQFDVIWLQNVLEHVRDPLGLLRQLESLVTPGNGVLVLTVPNDGSAFQEALLANGDIKERFWVAIPDHLSYFTTNSLKSAASETGWHCADLIGDCPIDLFLMHPGSNYVADSSRGPAAHQARLRLELQIGAHGHEAATAFYRSLAGVGLGRNLTAFLRRREASD